MDGRLSLSHHSLRFDSGVLQYNKNTKSHKSMLVKFRERLWCFRKVDKHVDS